MFRLRTNKGQSSDPGLGGDLLYLFQRNCRPCATMCILIWRGLESEEVHLAFHIPQLNYLARHKTPKSAHPTKPAHTNIVPLTLLGFRFGLRKRRLNARIPNTLCFQLPLDQAFLQPDAPSLREGRWIDQATIDGPHRRSANCFAFAPKNEKKNDVVLKMYRRLTKTSGAGKELLADLAHKNMRQLRERKRDSSKWRLHKCRCRAKSAADPLFLSTKSWSKLRMWGWERTCDWFRKLRVEKLRKGN